MVPLCTRAPATAHISWQVWGLSLNLVCRDARSAEAYSTALLHTSDPISQDVTCCLYTLLLTLPSMGQY